MFVGILDSNAVLVQEDQAARECRPLVAVDERLVLGDVEDVRRGQVAQVERFGVRRDVLGRMDGRFEETRSRIPESPP